MGDVRPADDFAKGHIKGAVNVPLYRPVEGRDTRDNLKRLAMTFFAMRATERNPDFAEEARALLPASGPLVVACDTGGYLEVTVEKKRNGKVVKSFKDKERVFGWESRSLKACHELRMSGFSDIYHRPALLAHNRYYNAKTINENKKTKRRKKDNVRFSPKPR